MSKTPFSLQNDSRIGVAVSRFLMLIALNLLTVICSLPVITVGASVTGLHRGLKNYVSGEDGAVKSFFSAFRESFLPATVLWVAALVVGFCLVLSFRIVQAFPGPVKGVLLVVFSMAALMLSMILVYAFPLLASYKLKTFEALENAILLSLAYFPRTLLLIGLSLLPLILFLVFPDTLLALLFVWVPVGFSVCALLCAGILEPVFRKLEKK